MCGMNQTRAHEVKEKKKPCLVNHISDKEDNSESLGECLAPTSI